MNRISQQRGNFKKNKSKNDNLQSEKIEMSGTSEERRSRGFNTYDAQRRQEKPGPK